VLPRRPKSKIRAKQQLCPTGFGFVQVEMSREGREGGEGFFMDKNFDRSKINL
jgi:hypothetical protein